MCEEVTKRARDQRKAGRTIHLSIKYSKTEGGGGFSRSLSLDNPTNQTRQVYQACLHLFHKFYDQKTVRQISILFKCSNSSLIFRDVAPLMIRMTSEGE